MSHFFGLILVGAVSVLMSSPQSAWSAPAGLGDGFLIEANLKQGGQEIEGRVLMAAGLSEWTTIALKRGVKGESLLKLEARASLIESDVVEVQTRVNGQLDGGTILVRLGERGQMTVGPNGNVGVARDAAATSVAVKVLRVRYAL